MTTPTLQPAPADPGPLHANGAPMICCPSNLTTIDPPHPSQRLYHTRIVATFLEDVLHLDPELPAETKLLTTDQSRVSMLFNTGATLTSIQYLRTDWPIQYFVEDSGAPSPFPWIQVSRYVILHS